MKNQEFFLLYLLFHFLISNKNIFLPNPEDDFIIENDEDDINDGFSDGYDDLDLSGFDEINDF